MYMYVNPLGSIEVVMSKLVAWVLSWKLARTNPINEATHWTFTQFDKISLNLPISLLRAFLDIRAKLVLDLQTE